MKRALVAIAVAGAVACGVTFAAQAQEKAPGVVILKGSPMGGVKFDHPGHVKLADNKCETCHHPSKPEKALKTKTQACQDCHTKAVAAPMKTNARGAFHDATAKSGTCINCHLTQNKAGKKTPTKCNECHKKENV